MLRCNRPFHQAPANAPSHLPLTIGSEHASLFSPHALLSGQMTHRKSPGGPQGAGGVGETTGWAAGGFWPLGTSGPLLCSVLHRDPALLWPQPELDPLGYTPTGGEDRCRGCLGLSGSLSLHRSLFMGDRVGCCWVLV
ncbi:hypothetical protein DPEC_G00286960 [Dallia pectoralis]|uniref:Uncharacterized protein n=1 Tax=Dallia pectoralis TaxID=75939 RepID=A0ACC2FK55_DALPE|nr:hypothetical protein DPEC_G00286960 [Dallia pectoralis]